MRVRLVDLPEGREGLIVDIESVSRHEVEGDLASPPADASWPLFFKCRFRWRWGARCGLGGAGKRLADLGIVAGRKVKVVRKAPFGGPIEVEVAGSRFLIGRGLAERIIVEA